MLSPPPPFWGGMDTAGGLLASGCSYVWLPLGQCGQVGPWETGSTHPGDILLVTWGIWGAGIVHLIWCVCGGAGKPLSRAGLSLWLSGSLALALVHGVAYRVLCIFVSWN